MIRIWYWLLIAVMCFAGTSVTAQNRAGILPAISGARSTALSPQGEKPALPMTSPGSSSRREMTKVLPDKLLDFSMRRTRQAGGLEAGFRVCGRA
jgi:hypothetical protein